MTFTVMVKIITPNGSYNQWFEDQSEAMVEQKRNELVTMLEHASMSRHFRTVHVWSFADCHHSGGTGFTLYLTADQIRCSDFSITANPS